MRCINCGRLGAQATGANLRCPACGHQWTVEDERSMAGYIRAVLKREPVTEASRAEAEDVTEIEIESHIEQAVDLDEMTVAELVQFADEEGIDLSGVRSGRKDEIIARILGEDEPEALEAEDEPEEPDEEE